MSFCKWDTMTQRGQVIARKDKEEKAKKGKSCWFYNLYLGLMSFPFSLRYLQSTWFGSDLPCKQSRDMLICKSMDGISKGLLTWGHLKPQPSKSLQALVQHSFTYMGSLKLDQNSSVQAEEGTVDWMCPLRQGGQARAEVSGVRLPSCCPVSRDGAGLAVINFTSVLNRGERTFHPLPFLLHPASFMALRTLPNLWPGQGALDWAMLPVCSEPSLYPRSAILQTHFLFTEPPWGQGWGLFEVSECVKRYLEYW
jgi:hypothetical protein